MKKIIVLTDLHMVPEGCDIAGLDPCRRLLNGIDHINRHHADADCIIVTGDLTDSGDRESYMRLRRMLSVLTPPCHLMLGNHDDRATFQSIFTDAPRDTCGFVQRAIDLGNTRLLLLDTLPTLQDGEWNGEPGFLCPDRMRWLSAQLSTAAGRRVLVFMHHPPHATGFAAMDASRLRNEHDFYELLLRHGNVSHIFAGHIHRTISGSHRGIPFSIFKSPAHQQPMTFDSPDSSLSVDEPAAYGIVMISDTSVLVHTEDYELSGVGAGTDRS